MRFKSWFKSLAADKGSRTTVKSDVSSAKSFTLHIRLSVRSLIYTRKKRGPNIESSTLVSIPLFLDDCAKDGGEEFFTEMHCAL